MAAVATVAAYLAAGGLRIARRACSCPRHARTCSCSAALALRRDGVAVPARPVRARAAAPRRDAAGGRLHGDTRPAAGAARPDGRVAGGSGCCACTRPCGASRGGRWRRSPCSARSPSQRPASSRAWSSASRSSLRRSRASARTSPTRSPRPGGRSTLDDVRVRSLTGGGRLSARDIAAEPAHARERAAVGLRRAASRRWTTCSRSGATTASRASRSTATRSTAARGS